MRSATYSNGCPGFSCSVTPSVTSTSSLKIFLGFRQRALLILFFLLASLLLPLLDSTTLLCLLLMWKPKVILQREADHLLFAVSLSRSNHSLAWLQNFLKRGVSLLSQACTQPMSLSCFPVFSEFILNSASSYISSNPLLPKMERNIFLILIITFPSSFISMKAYFP